MTRTHRPPAEQLSLQLSLEASVTLTDELGTWKTYARELEAKLDSATQTQANLEAKLDGLKKDNKSWERSYKRLKAERDQIYQARLSDAAHPLHDECKQLREEVDSLRSKLYQRVWHELEGLRRPDSTGVEGLAKRLRLLVHPDRWSQGQLATELAHELSVSLNQHLGQGKGGMR